MKREFHPKTKNPTTIHKPSTPRLPCVKGAGAKRLRDCCHKFATTGCLRRPYLFRLAGKDRGEKSAWMRSVRSASEFKQAPSFGLAFHMVLTLWAFYYAPPDTGVSSLRLVAVERLPSIEGAMEIWMGKTSLRADSSVAALPGRLLFHKGALGQCRNGWKRNYSAGKKSFWLILGGGYAIIN